MRVSAEKLRERVASRFNKGHSSFKTETSFACVWLASDNTALYTLIVPQCDSYHKWYEIAGNPTHTLLAASLPGETAKGMVPARHCRLLFYIEDPLILRKVIAVLGGFRAVSLLLL